MKDTSPLIPIKYEKRLSIVGVLRIALPWQTRDGTQGREALATRFRGEAKCNLWRLGNT